LSSGCESRWKEPFDAANDFLVVYQVATVGGSDAAFNAFDEAGLPLQHVAYSLFHHLRDVLAFAGRKRLELRLGIG